MLVIQQMENHPEMMIKMMTLRERVNKPVPKEVFEFIDYVECPTFESGAAASLLSKVLTPALFDELKVLPRTQAGYTVSNAIQAGVTSPDLPLGCTAGDEESYELFKALYDPVISGYYENLGCGVQFDLEKGVHAIPPPRSAAGSRSSSPVPMGKTDRELEQAADRVEGSLVQAEVAISHQQR